MKVDYSDKSHNKNSRCSSERNIGNCFLIWIIMLLSGIALKIAYADIAGHNPTLKGIIIIAEFAYIGIYVFGVFIKLGKFNKSFIESGILFAISEILRIVTRDLTFDDDMAKGVLSIILALVQTRMYYCVCVGNSALTHDNVKLSSKWHALGKWWKICGIGLFLGFIGLIIPFLRTIILFGLLILLIVIVILLICHLIFLCMTAAHFIKKEK